MESEREWYLREKEKEKEKINQSVRNNQQRIDLDIRHKQRAKAEESRTVVLTVF